MIQIDQHRQHDHDQQPCLQHGIVARLDRRQQQPAQPRQCEQAFDDDRAAQDLDQDQSHERHQRNPDVAQQMGEEDGPRRHALGGRGPHIILPECGDDALPHELAVGGRLQQRQAQHRQRDHRQVFAQGFGRRDVHQRRRPIESGRHPDQQHQADPEYRRRQPEQVEGLNRPV
jgi:hypothetical protein